MGGTATSVLLLLLLLGLNDNVEDVGEDVDSPLAH